MPLRRMACALLLPLLFLARPGFAQGSPAPLEGFVARVARLWAAGDAAALVALSAPDGRLVVDLGGVGGGAVDGRHAAAALRDLFGRREHVAIRTTQVTVSGGSPPRGFGELSWSSRERGVDAPQRSVVYVGAEYQAGSWRIREIRVMR